MPAGTQPIFIQRPHVQWQNTITTQNTTVDGSNTAWEQPLWTSNTQNGSYIEYVRVKSLGTNFSTAIRIFLNDGGTVTVANNNALITEMSLPNTTWTESATVLDFVHPMRISIPAGYNLYATASNTVNSTAGFAISAVGGHYGDLPGGAKPIFLRKPRIYFSNTILTQNQTRIATTGTITQVFAANTDSGSYLDHIRAKPLGTNVATVVRVFINNGGVTTQQNNNVLFTEVTLAATTLSEVAGLVDVPIPMKIPLDPGYNVYVTLGTTVAAGWNFTGVGGDY